MAYILTSLSISLRYIGCTFIAWPVVTGVHDEVRVRIDNTNEDATPVAVRAVFAHAAVPGSAKLVVATARSTAKRISLVRSCLTSAVAHHSLASPRGSPGIPAVTNLATSMTTTAVDDCNVMAHTPVKRFRVDVRLQANNLGELKGEVERKTPRMATTVMTYLAILTQM